VNNEDVLNNVSFIDQSFHLPMHVEHADYVARNEERGVCDYQYGFLC
jgi:hypothetical protein